MDMIFGQTLPKAATVIFNMRHPIAIKLFMEMQQAKMNSFGQKEKNMKMATSQLSIGQTKRSCAPFQEMILV